MKSQITKISTLYRVEREKNPTIFNSLRDEFLEVMVKSKPNFDPKIIVSSRPF